MNIKLTCDSLEANPTRELGGGLLHHFGLGHGDRGRRINFTDQVYDWLESGRGGGLHHRFGPGHGGRGWICSFALEYYPSLSTINGHL